MKEKHRRQTVLPKDTSNSILPTNNKIPLRKSTAFGKTAPQLIGESGSGKLAFSKNRAATETRTLLCWRENGEFVVLKGKNEEGKKRIRKGSKEIVRQCEFGVTWEKHRGEITQSTKSIFRIYDVSLQV